jgi:hypothetical protein
VSTDYEYHENDHQGEASWEIMAPLINRLTVPIVMVLLTAGCGSSQQRTEGVQELAKLQTDVHGLTILVSAGVTKQEYSQRFEDTLLKVGDLSQAEIQTLPKFPQKDQPTVKAIYAHLSQSMAAYKNAREYISEKSSTDIFARRGAAFFRRTNTKLSSRNSQRLPAWILARSTLGIGTVKGMW